MWTAGAAIADARPLYDIHWVTMTHDKRRHTDHGGATTHVATALGTDSTARDFLGVGVSTQAGIGLGQSSVY